MKLILIRHGNTFDATQTPYWVGAAEDMALTKAGLQQAAALADWLTSQKLVPTRIFAGPLSRHLAFAGVLAHRLGVERGPIKAETLNELDYGLWSGRTDPQIEGLGLGADFKVWKEGAWPQQSQWGESEALVLGRVKQFLTKLAEEGVGQDETVAAISSNGLIRFFLRFCGDQYRERLVSGGLKVATGAYCLLEGESYDWRCKEWDVRPKRN